MATQEATALALLLKQAQSCQEAEKLHHAIATYFKLVEHFPGTDEAQTARRELFNLAQRLEAEGKMHQATHLYNRLAAIG